jgi:hypothetical protein
MWTQVDKNRAARCFRALGWERYRERQGTRLEWRYRRETIQESLDLLGTRRRLGTSLIIKKLRRSPVNLNNWERREQFGGTQTDSTGRLPQEVDLPDSS